MERGWNWLLKLVILYNTNLEILQPNCKVFKLCRLWTALPNCLFSTKIIVKFNLDIRTGNSITGFFHLLWRTQNGKGEMPIDQKDLSNDLPPFTFCGLSKKNPDFADSILFQTWSLTGIFSRQKQCKVILRYWSFKGDPKVS